MHRAHRVRRREDRHPGNALELLPPTSRWHPVDLSAVSSSTFATAPSADGAFDVRRGKPFGFTSACTTATPSSTSSTSSTRSIRRAAATSLWITSAVDTGGQRKWFDEHPRWTRHFTPTPASWLNQIECWFSILARHILRRGSFTSTDEPTSRENRRLRCSVPRDRPAPSAGPTAWKSRDEPAKLRPRGTRAAMRRFPAVGRGKGRPEKTGGDRRGARTRLVDHHTRAPVGFQRRDCGDRAEDHGPRSAQ